MLAVTGNVGLGLVLAVLLDAMCAAYGYTRAQADEERRYRREIRRLTRRGYLSRGRLSVRGKAVVNADWWENPVLREFVAESKR